MEDKKEEVIAIRKPIKVLHFSDGILEVFDDDDKVPEPIEEISEKVDEVSCTRILFVSISFMK